MKLLKNIGAWCAQHKIGLLTGIVIGFFLWLIYGVGQITGAHKQSIAESPVDGNATLAEIHKMIADGKKGRVILTDAARFREQGSNKTWFINDFNKSVNQTELDFFRANEIPFDGNVSIRMEPYRAGETQLLVASVFDTAGKVVISMFYILITVFMLFYIKQSVAQGGIFGKRSQKVTPWDGPSIKLDDVAGHKGAKHEVTEVIEYLKHPEKFKNTGARPPRGIILYGPPGNGKTLIAKAIAGEAKAGFIEQNASSFVQIFVGAGAMAIRQLFKDARAAKPCVIFIDEIDAVGGHRSGMSAGGGGDERVQTINALLAELDGFGDNEGIVVIAATNRLENLDEALIRPGRFDRKVCITLPGKADRFDILKVHAKKIPHLEAALDKWAERTHGFSGADLANLVNEAALEAVRDNRTSVCDQDFTKARDRILMGPRNHGFVMSDEENRAIAYHEAGHAIMRVVTGQGRVEKVTILPHGQALGVTISDHDEEMHIQTKEHIHNELLVLMGGRAAEDVFCGKPSTGAGNDMERASLLARRSVMRYGFGSIGPYIPESKELVGEMDREAGKWVLDAYNFCKETLDTNRAAMEEVVAKLLDEDEVDGQFVHDVFQKHQKGVAE